MSKKPNLSGTNVFVNGKKVIHIKVSQLHPDPHQPRKVFDKDALNELAKSIKSQGLQQLPLVSFWKDEGGLPQYIIKAGERRWRAHKIAAIENIDCILENVEYDPEIYSQKRELAQAAENSNREGQTHSEIVGVVERAVAAEIKSSGQVRGSVDKAITQVALAFGKSNAWAYNYHRLSSLHPELLQLLDEKDDDLKINFSVACKLCVAPEEQQIDILNRAKKLRAKGGFNAMQGYIIQKTREILSEQGVKVRGRRPSDEKRLFERFINKLTRAALNFCGERHSSEHKIYLEDMVTSFTPIEVDHHLRDIKMAIVTFTEIQNALQIERDKHYKKVFNG